MPKRTFIVRQRPTLIGCEQGDIAAAADGMVAAGAAEKRHEQEGERQHAEGALHAEHHEAGRRAQHGAGGTFQPASPDIAVMLQPGNDDDEGDRGPFPVGYVQPVGDAHAEKDAESHTGAMDEPHVPVVEPRVGDAAQKPKAGGSGIGHRLPPYP
jgi:hypothetical protein